MELNFVTQESNCIYDFRLNLEPMDEEASYFLAAGALSPSTYMKEANSTRGPVQVWSERSSQEKNTILHPTNFSSAFSGKSFFFLR